MVIFSIGSLWASILEFSLELLDKNNWVLCYLDATEWSIGKFNLHILVLSIDYQGIAIPIYFEIYSHKGVLSQEKRAYFLENAAVFIDLKSKTVIADREFIGNDYFLRFQKLGINRVCGPIRFTNQTADV